MAWTKCLFLFLVVFLILPAGDCGKQDLDCSEFEDATQEELQEASEELQRGMLSRDGLKMFRCQAKFKPTDWRIHGMLGQALIQRPGELDSGIESLRRAYTLGPTSGKVRYGLCRSLVTALRKSLQISPQQTGAEALRRESIDVTLKMLSEKKREAASWLWLGRLIAIELPLNETGAVAPGKERTARTYARRIHEIIRFRKIDDDPAVSAWTTAVKLNAKLAEAHELLAWRLMKIGDKKKYMKHAKKLRKLKPKLASGHEVYAAALMMGIDTRNMTSKLRKLATKAIKAAIHIRTKALERTRGKGINPQDNYNQARNHYFMFRLLSTDPSVDESTVLAGGAVASKGVEKITQAMNHIKTAAKLRPDLYEGMAKKFKGLELPIQKPKGPKNPKVEGLSQFGGDALDRILDSMDF